MSCTMRGSYTERASAKASAIKREFKRIDRNWKDWRNRRHERHMNLSLQTEVRDWGHVKAATVTETDVILWT